MNFIRSSPISPHIYSHSPSFSLSSSSHYSKPSSSSSSYSINSSSYYSLYFILPTRPQVLQAFLPRQPPCPPNFRPVHPICIWVRLAILYFVHSLVDENVHLYVILPFGINTSILATNHASFRLEHCLAIGHTGK